MSETASESDLDFSASEEDEYLPTDEEDSDDVEDDETEENEETDGTPNLCSNKPKKKLISRKIAQDDDDSDSSVENYLVNPDEIDFSLDFFNPNKISQSNVPKFDCNIGLNLSDSEEEVFEAVPSTSRDAATKLLDFNHHANFNKQLERNKEHLRNLQSTNFGQDNENDVSKLLAMGEPSLANSKPSKSKRKQPVESSDESDFEEVIESIPHENKNDVEVRIGPVIKQKPNRLQAEIEASIKRKINRVKKENQLAMHKVHLLSWIAYGNFVNKVLNSNSLMGMVLNLMPSQSCYPKEQTDQKYFEQIIKWYKTTVGLKTKEQNCNLKCLPPLATSLALQIQSKMAICKKDFVFIFVVLLRSIGIQCRLVINLATVPIRPPAKELCVISLKASDKTKTGDANKTKQSSKKQKVTSSEKSKEMDGKDAKSKAKPDKVKSKAKSITGESSTMPKKSPEPSNAKQSLKSKLEAALKTTKSHSADADKKMLKRRSVSVQDISSVNNNIKRSRVTSSNDTTSANLPTTNVIKKTVNPSKETSQNELKRRSVSLESPSSISKVAKSLSKFKSKVASKLTSTLVNSSPIARRTRKQSLSRANETITSKRIPQLDGGDDGKKSRRKPEVFQLKFPLRARSVSPTSALNNASRRSKSVTAVVTVGNTLETKKTKPNLLKVRLPSRSRSRSPTSEHISRKSKISTNSRSKDSSPSSPVKSSTKNVSKAKDNKLTVADDKSTKKGRTVSKSPTPSTSKSAKMESKESSQSLPVKTSTKDDSKAKKVANVAGDKNTKKVRTVSKSPAPSTATAAAMKSNEASPPSPVKPSTKDDSKAKNVEKSTVAGEKNSKKDNPKQVRSVSKSTKSSTLKADAVETNSPSVSPIKSKSDKKGSVKGSVSIKTNSTTKITEPNTATSSTKSSKSSKCTKATTSNATSTNKDKAVKIGVKRKETQNASSDSDFAPSPKKKMNSSTITDKPLPKRVENLKKRIDRRILSTDDESIEASVRKDDMNYWIEVYCEAESKWLCLDLFKLKVNCIDDLKKKATKPISYCFAWNNNNKIKDVSPRYCSQWNTATRKLRVPSEWLNGALSRYKEPISQRCVAEDRELEEIHSNVPIPTAISELKDHPLYVLPRHLLKFEGIYPPNPVPVGYIREEPIYSRLCVHTLHSREIWVKQARTVKPGEMPYKIVKARPKWDRLANKMLEPQPLEIFGFWQTQPYEPPVAQNGIVPRNAYGNVELFKPEMLPINTVHLRLPGLNRVCAKLKIDCAQAVVGFDFHGGSSHPTFDGFVVCEEFSELVTMQWWEEQAEADRKAKEKQEKRIYDNWKKLTKGLLIREHLQRKYDFAGKDASSSKEK